MSPAEEIQEPRPVLAGAEVACREWRRAVNAQRIAVLDHGDFYELGGQVVDTLRCLQALIQVVVVQVGGYGDGRVLRDDEAADPVARLDQAVRHLGTVDGLLVQAERAANGFWSEISHIGVGESW